MDWNIEAECARNRRRSAIQFLDRVIVALMVAIVLSVSGPVCLILWQQHGRANRVDVQSAVLQTSAVKARR